MIRVRVRYSLSRDKLRDSDAGLRDPGPPMPLLPPRGSAFTGIVTQRYDQPDERQMQLCPKEDNNIHRSNNNKKTAESACLFGAMVNCNSRSMSDVDDLHELRCSPIRDALRRMGGER